MADEISRRMYTHQRDHLVRRALQEVDAIVTSAALIRSRLTEGRTPIGDERRLLADAGSLAQIIARLEAHTDLAYLLDDPEDEPATGLRVAAVRTHEEADRA